MQSIDRVYLKTVQLLFMLGTITFADTTPGPVIHAPQVPSFLHVYRFTTVKMNIFTTELAEMQPWFFSRLLLNPAIITDLEHPRFYIDLYNDKKTPLHKFTIPEHPSPPSDYLSYAFQSITEQYSVPHAGCQTPP